MRHLLIAVCLACPIAPAFAENSIAVATRLDDGEFSSLLDNLSLEARTDLGGFKARLVAQFHAPQDKVEAVVRTMAHPADAYMVFKISEVAGKPVDAVVTEYQTNRDKGWGVMARNLGIRPGSREFHALKKDSLNGNGQGKGKGHAQKRGQGRGRGGRK